jgi:CRP/FNR family transcriptional regulator, cyclic AMP receptor protein
MARSASPVATSQAALMSAGWFAELPKAVRADIVSRGRTRALASGERLFSKGDPPGGIYAVLEGIVCVSGANAEGREIILDFYGPGSWIGEISVLDGGPRLHDAEAHVDALVLRVGPPQVERLLAAHPTFARSLLRLEAQRLRTVLTAIEWYSTPSLQQRLANRLLLLAASHGRKAPEGLELDLRLSQEMIARLVGSTRQRVNQILADWQREGIVKHEHGRIVFLDEARVRKLARL